MQEAGCRMQDAGNRKSGSRESGLKCCGRDSLAAKGVSSAARGRVDE
jgi:hypothetical protein